MEPTDHLDTHTHTHARARTHTHTHTHTCTRTAATRPGVLHAAHLRLPSRRCHTQVIRSHRPVPLATSSPGRPTHVVPHAWPCLDQTRPAPRLQVCFQGCLPPLHRRPPRPSAHPDGDGRLRRRATATAATLGAHTPRVCPELPAATPPRHRPHPPASPHLAPNDQLCCSARDRPRPCPLAPRPRARCGAHGLRHPQ